MYRWITIISNRPVAALNTLWYARESYPQKQLAHLTLFCAPSAKKSLNQFRRYAETLLTYHGQKMPNVEIISYKPGDVEPFRNDLKRLLNRSREKVMIDMTSGRKAHAALLLLMGELFPGVVEHVFYNFLDDDRYLSFPYPCLPPNAGRIIDLLNKK